MCVFLSYRRSYDRTTFCDHSTIASNLTFGPTAPLVCQKNCLFKGERVGLTEIYCIAFSLEDDWSYGYNTFEFDFNKTDDYEFSYSSCCWAGLAVMGYNSTTGSSWEIRSSLNTNNRTDIQRVNTTPQTIMPPVVTVRLGFTYEIRIPAVDPDGDIVRCRWSSWSLGECAGIKLTLKNL